MRPKEKVESGKNDHQSSRKKENSCWWMKKDDRLEVVPRMREKKGDERQGYRKMTAEARPEWVT